MSAGHLVAGEITCVAQDSSSGAVPAEKLYRSQREGITTPRIRPVPRLRYRWILFKNAGSVIVLYWSFVMFVALHHVLNILGHAGLKRKYAFFGGFVFPFVGMLTDAYVNRYKFIRFSIIVMWISSLFLPVMYLPSILHKHYLDYFRMVVYFLLSCGTLCCQINLIQFGTDQLRDSPSSEISSFLKWHAWTYFASMVVVDFVQVCIVYTHNWISYFYLPILISLALCMDFLLSRHLIMDQMSQNSWKLVCGILKYALKNKYPKLRSSFVFWDDKWYSRIDLAKSIFGGPYSVKEVEEVKSLFQISILIILSGVFISVVSVNDWLIIQPHLNPDENIACLVKLGSLKGGYMFIAISIPIYEWILLPLSHSCLPYCRILFRTAVGGLCCILYLTLNSIFIALDKWKPHLQQQPNLELPPQWFVCLSVLNCVGLYVILVAGTEFVSAQCPQCMRGFVYGFFYFIYAASFGVMVELELQKNLVGHKYFLWFHVILAVALAGIYSVLVCFYKMRQHYQNSQEDF